MKKVKVGYVDFWKDFVPEEYIFHQRLSKYYDVEITNDNPDFVICSTFGNQFYKYKCPRILFVGEAFTPDFNLYDYAIGFDRMQFGDRYLRYPLCLLNTKDLEEAIHKTERPDDYFLNREKFCSYVVSSGGGVGDIRNWLYDRISEYKTVDSGGRFRNNLPDGKPVADKKAFQENYRFSLAFENTKFSGYITEKIIDGWAAGTIPIYYGDSDIKKDFNEKAMIICEGKEQIEEVIERIKAIEKNEETYLEVAKQPIFNRDSEVYQLLESNQLEVFLKNIFDQEPEEAFRRSSKHTMWGQLYEYRLAKWEKFESHPFISWLRKTKRKFFGLKKIT